VNRPAVIDLLRAAPLIDGHNDLLWELRQGKDPADSTLMTDLPRMAAGGVGGQFWSVYVPSDLPADRAVPMTLEQIDALMDMVRRNPDRLELARSADEVRVGALIEDHASPPGRRADSGPAGAPSPS